MATFPGQRRTKEITYPTTDGKPIAETQIHRDDVMDLIQSLEDYSANQPQVYVGGNLLLYYEEGNRRKHVSPDLFVTLGIKKEPLRDDDLFWIEGRAPDVVEITSKSTKREDMKKNFEIYRDVLKVSEYFLFDRTHDDLKSPLHGYRLVGSDDAAIEPQSHSPCQEHHSGRRLPRTARGFPRRH
jgi:Uma2 family endonuclease